MYRKPERMLEEIVTRLNPQDAVAWGMLARARVATGQYQEAIAAADQALRMNPENREAIIARGRASLQLGDRDSGVRLIAGVVVFLLSQAALNWIFKLGEFPGILDRVGGVPVTGGLYPFALIIFFLISIIGVPLSGLAAVFGEEYGWRGFLQSELVKLGPRRGVFLVGLIWGVWHFPIILSGIHTYPASATGLLLAVVFFVLAGFVLGYAVMKTESIWVAAFMHGVLNSLYAFVLNYLVRPYDRVSSFGLGVYGLICLAAVVLFILRDPIWRRKALNL